VEGKTAEQQRGRWAQHRWVYYAPGDGAAAVLSFSFVKNLGVNFPSGTIDTYRDIATILLSASFFSRL
jgi:hypothetical protein